MYVLRINPVWEAFTVPRPSLFRSKYAISGYTLAVGILIGVALSLQFGLHADLVLSERIRRLLECLYFFAGIVIAVLATVGLNQLRLTREGMSLTQRLAEKNEARESMVLAGEQCRYFAENLTTSYEELIQRINANRKQYSCIVLRSNLQKPPFVIKDGQITIEGFKVHEAIDPFNELQPIEFLNLLEGFAIPFAAKVADDSIGYFETGIPFMQIMQELMPCIMIVRMNGMGRYLAAVSLYVRWQERYTEERLTNIKNEAEAELRRAREK